MQIDLCKNNTPLCSVHGGGLSWRRTGWETRTGMSVNSHPRLDLGRVPECCRAHVPPGCPIQSGSLSSSSLCGVKHGASQCSSRSTDGYAKREAGAGGDGGCLEDSASTALDRRSPASVRQSGPSERLQCPRTPSRPSGSSKSYRRVSNNISRS